MLGIAPQMLITKAGLSSNLYRPVVQTGTNATSLPTTTLVYEGDDPWQIVAEIAERVNPSVVGVVNVQGGVYDFFGRQYSSESSGSGVIVSSDGYIVTNYHVVEGQKSLTVYLADGRELPAQVIGTDSRTDLAVIKINATGLPAAVFGDSDLLRAGELAIAIGNPLGIEFSGAVTMGVVSGLNRVVDISQEASVRLIQTDAVINPGNSGGPLVNAKGEVIGLNTVKLVTSEVEGMGFAIPSNMVSRVVNEIMTTGKVRRALLGVSLTDPANVQDAALTVTRGAYVATSGGAAAQAGIRKGDVIVEMDGVTVNSVSALRALLAEKYPGDVVALKVIRGKEQISIQATLGTATEQKERSRICHLDTGRKEVRGNPDFLSINCCGMWRQASRMIRYGCYLSGNRSFHNSSKFGGREGVSGTPGMAFGAFSGMRPGTDTSWGTMTGTL